jgi:acyl-CoA oxidase
MIYTRVTIINNSAYQVAQAAVIASRFSVVREQGVGVATDTDQELAIIDCKSQHYRLLTILAQAYALIFASQACTTAYRAVQREQLDGNHGNLPQVHALTAGLKAYSTQVALGAEDARKYCGGFGSSDMSGLPAIVGTLAPTPTLEGENYVTYQQVG